MSLKPGQLLRWTVDKVDLNGAIRESHPFVVVRVYDLNGTKVIDFIKGDKVLEAWRYDYVAENAEIVD